MKISIDQALLQAVEAHEEGKLQEAERLYKAIIRSDPTHPDANHNLGVLAVSLDQADVSLPLFKTAIATNPKIAQFWFSYINALIQTNRLDRAKSSIEEAKTFGVDAEKLELIYLRMKGRINHVSPPQKQLDRFSELYRKGEYADAVKTALVITREFPTYPPGWKALGAAHKQIGQLKEALTAMQSSVQLAPRDAEAHSNLGVTLTELERHDEALAYYKKAIALDSDFSKAHHNLGITLKKLGRLDQAVASYNQAIALEPHDAKAYSDLGVALKELGRLKEAEAQCNQAIMLAPRFAEAHNNLGITLQALGRLDEAVACYNRAIILKPDLAEVYSNLGVTLKELGRIDEALASYNQAIALDPDATAAISNLLFLQASAKFNATRYLKDAERFTDFLERQDKSVFSSWNCDEHSTRLRVGFVSGDFSDHPVGYFLEEVLAELRSKNIELYAYPTRHLFGETTERIKALFHCWTPISGKPDQNAAATIHSDGIHILIDLSGHTNHSRLPVFGWRPAPIQISWLGYFASTGLLEIDYIVGDPFVTPEEETHHYVEKIWQLPETYLCFTPPTQKVPVGALPARSNGFVTFGCFNQLYKMTDEVISVRAEILRHVPESRLFLKDKQFDYKPARDRVLSRFAALGIATDRLLLEGKTKRHEYLACYNRIDIALSPFPYGGGTTSVEGLWMGVPVITKKGHHFLSHLGESIAHNTGLSNWIAVDNADYISKAIEFSSDLKSLESLRANLREHLLSTPLFDQKRFSNHFARALWEMKDLFDQSV